MLSSFLYFPAKRSSFLFLKAKDLEALPQTPQALWKGPGPKLFCRRTSYGGIVILSLLVSARYLPYL